MKAHGFKLCWCFSLPVSVCNIINFALAYVRIGSYIVHVYKGRHTTKKMSVINESSHVAVMLQLLEMSSISTPNQTILNVCTRYIF